jgi:hypothetical protein
MLVSPVSLRDGAGYGTLPEMNLAVIAAFTAAATSLINIIVTARLTSGSQFRQWQREEARPSTARTSLSRARLAGHGYGRPSRGRNGSLAKTMRMAAISSRKKAST